MPTLAAAVEMGARGHRAGQRPRGQHRDVRAQRIRHQLEQGHRSVSTHYILISLGLTDSLA